MKPPYPKYVICPDVEGLPHYLTAGKRYEVVGAAETSVSIKDDDGDRRCFFWTESDALNGADWIIPEDETPEEDPPEWAVRLACERGSLSYGLYKADGHVPATRFSIKAHARTIAKHEQEPVGPDLVLAREMAAQDAARESLNGAAYAFRSGERDDYYAVTHALATIKHIRKHGLPS